MPWTRLVDREDHQVGVEDTYSKHLLTRWEIGTTSLYCVERTSQLQ